MDADEPQGNGIVCSGGMAETDPLCTEQFANSSVASLKVVPEPGYELAYWEMNGGIIQQADAGPLYLSTMPMLAGIVPIPAITNTATMKAHCLSLSLESVTFEGMSAQILQDSGDPYPGPNSTPPQPHWKKTNEESYRPAPVVFTSGSTMTAKATFTVEPADFSGEIFITGVAEVLETSPAEHLRHVVFAPQNANVENGVASVTILSSTMFPENTVDIFDPLRMTWGYGPASGPFHEAGTSENQIYITWALPACKTEMPPCIQAKMYHTVVHVGSQAAKGVTGLPGTDDHLVLDAIWEKAFDRNTKTQPIRRMSDGALLTYYGFFDTPKSVVVDGTLVDVRDGIWEENWDLLKNTLSSNNITSAAGLISTGNGQCHSWAEFLYEVMKAQGLKKIGSGNIEKVIIDKRPENDLGFAIKKWNRSANSTSPWLANPICLDAGIDGSNAKEPDSISSGACDAKGVPGQGNSPNPPSYFGKHYIVLIGAHYYDPSYGLGPFSFWNKKAYEDAAFAGRLYYDMDGKLHLGELPPDDDKPLDDSDLINLYSNPLPFE